MWIAAGVVRKDAPAVDALIELYSVPEDFQKQLPVCDREQLASLNLPRLGTAISDASGAFHIEYSTPAAREDGYGAPVHLWLAASATDVQPPGALSYQDAFVRLRAGELEHFVVTLGDGSMARRAEAGRVTEISPDEVLKTRAADLKLSTALREASMTSLAERGTARRTFRTDVARKLLDDTSGVPRNAAGKPVDDHYVEPLAPVRALYALWYDEFENNDGCSQEFGAPWASCWYDYGDTGFDIKVDDQGWLKVEKDTGDQRRHFVERDVGDLSGMSAAWMSFNHKRENLDDGGDRVYFKVYKDGVWYLLDQFQGPGNDLGEHAGNYYDLTPYISSDLRIMFETENQASMKDGDRVKFDNFNIFAWGDRAPASASMR
jgi:hypothetical protein